MSKAVVTDARAAAAAAGAQGAVQGVAEEIVKTRDLVHQSDEASISRHTDLASRLGRLQTDLHAQRQALDGGLTETQKRIADLASTVLKIQRGRTEHPTPRTHPRDVLVKIAIAHIIAKERMEPVGITLRRLYDDARYVLRAATDPAMTSVAGWAAELTGARVADIVGLVAASSAYSKLAARGIQVDLTGSGGLRVPARPASAAAPDPFVQEGAPIPLRQLTLSAETLLPRKASFIVPITRELFDLGPAGMESFARNALDEDISRGVDSILVDAVAADARRPAGLRNGVTGLTPNAGGGANALSADLRMLLAAIPSPIDPVVIVSSGDALGAALLAPLSVVSVPVIPSQALPPGTVILVDAADFVSEIGTAANFQASEVSLLHESDTPLPFSAPGTPNTVAAPSRSLFQTASIAFRLTAPVSWVLRRSGRVAWLENATW